MQHAPLLHPLPDWRITPCGPARLDEHNRYPDEQHDRAPKQPHNDVAIALERRQVHRPIATVLNIRGQVPCDDPCRCRLGGHRWLSGRARHRAPREAVAREARLTRRRPLVAPPCARPLDRCTGNTRPPLGVRLGEARVQGGATDVSARRERVAAVEDDRLVRGGELERRGREVRDVPRVAVGDPYEQPANGAGG